MLSCRHDQLDVMEQVKPLLRSVSTDFSVPSVVVVGMQSSGKSSVLEHATGLAFPRGEGMCTRVPTVVSVGGADEGGVTESTLCISTSPNYEDEWQPRVAHDDTAAFGTAIERLTNQLTKQNEIGEEPIYVKLRKPHAPTFTITDVPGITCNSKNLNDSEQLEKRLVHLTKTMIGTSPDTLVLVVLSATDDFATCKALQLARTLDPEGERTIGVVTKIDNLPDGSTLVKKMSGDEIPLQHGYFAVRNRTQKEIDEGVALAALDELEAELFRSDPVLSQLPPEAQGMACLLEKIKAEQSKRLDKCIPELREAIKRHLNDEQKALARLPESLGDDVQRQRFLNRALARIASDFRRCATSDTSVLSAACTVTNLSARMNDTMNAMEARIRKEQRDFLSDPVKDELRAGAKEALGYNLSNFMQGDLFRDTFVASTAPLLEACATCAVVQTQAHVRACFDALVHHHVGESALPALGAALCELFHGALEKAVKEASDGIARQQRAEANVTFTTNHYYMQTIAKFQEMVQCNMHNWKKGGLDGTTDGEVNDIPREFMNGVARDARNNSNDAEAIRGMQVSLHAYSKVVQKRFSDTVAILLINEVAFGAVTILTDKQLDWSALLLDKVKEHPKIAQKRKKIEHNIEALSKALALLQPL